ncbi:M23 family metallopeptidase [Luteibacter yeojuensis]|uniref:M23 family metallopeptidase n=1 Tax=Luteibacter yeojuensis TaxID=345309 RepID=A0A7X5QTS4_9GAMM|nr:M23 family metallopeptidase [Luteibacter yeojuensis]NID15280.1 M23 family metallopeptidase [Luteibacter yeojuensis]
MRTLACALLGALLGGATVTATGATAALPASVQQGALVIGHAAPGTRVTVAGKPVHVGDDGLFVFGVGRDEAGPVAVTLGRDRRDVAVTPRDWPIERVEGVPPKTVNPPAAIAARIAREQAEVVAARTRDDSREDFAKGFAWPVTGRISGRFGNQRIYDGDPKAPHSGMDIAVPEGTPVKAPADGVITFAKPDLYLTGGTLLLDHGFGLSSNFLHLSRIDVKVGQHVRQGQVIGAAGRTGRATGPHLHWGFNWFGVRLDPLLLPGIAQPL